jgi:ABC-type amino acid transport substrate-binding protein
MTVSTDNGPVRPDQGLQRRSLLRRGGMLALGAGVVGAAAGCSGGAAATTAQSSTSSNSLLSKWLSTKKASLGFWLSAPPVQFTDPKTGKPSGYAVEVTQAMMKDMGVELEIVELPFEQQIAAAAAGKIDAVGGPLTIEPSRALKGLFVSFPVFFENNVMWLSPTSTATSMSDLSHATIAVLSGSSQQITGQSLLPQATFAPFDTVQDAVSDVSSGRAEAVLLSTNQLIGQAAQYPHLKVMQGPPLFFDVDTFYLPEGDFVTEAWISSWLRYAAAHETLYNLWVKWFGTPAAKQFGVHTTAVGPFGNGIAL